MWWQGTGLGVAIRTPFLLTWKVHQIFYLVAVYLVFGLKHRNTRIEQHLGGCRGRRTHLVQHIMGGTPLHWRAQRCPKGSHQPPAEGDLPPVLILPLNHRKTGKITEIRVFFHKCLSRRANSSLDRRLLYTAFNNMFRTRAQWSMLSMKRSKTSESMTQLHPSGGLQTGEEKTGVHRYVFQVHL